MDLYTRAVLVRAIRVELKQQARRRRAGAASAAATDRDLDSNLRRDYGMPPRRPYVVDERPPPIDPVVEDRIARRILRMRRGVRAGRDRLIDHANPTRPEWSVARVGVTPRPGREVGVRIRQTVAPDAPPRRALINHGMTAEEILGRERRVLIEMRRRERLAGLARRARRRLLVDVERDGASRRALRRRVRAAESPAAAAARERQLENLRNRVRNDRGPR